MQVVAELGRSGAFLLQGLVALLMALSVSAVWYAFRRRPIALWAWTWWVLTAAVLTSALAATGGRKGKLAVSLLGLGLWFAVAPMAEAAADNEVRMLKAGIPLLMASDGGLLDPDEVASNDPRAAVDLPFALGEGHFLWLRAMGEKGMTPMAAIQARLKRHAADSRVPADRPERLAAVDGLPRSVVTESDADAVHDTVMAEPRRCRRSVRAGRSPRSPPCRPRCRP